MIANHKGKLEGSPTSTAARYSDLLERHNESYGEIDLELIMEIMREHYRSMCEDHPEHKGCAQTIYQAAMAPGSGDFLVSSARGNYYKTGTYEASAYNQQIHKFNIFELIEREP